MANGNNSRIVTWVLKLVYGKIINYICSRPDLTGDALRTRIRLVFGSAPNEAILNRLLAIARTRCEVKA